MNSYTEKIKNYLDSTLSEEKVEELISCIQNKPFKEWKNRVEYLESDMCKDFCETEIKNIKDAKHTAIEIGAEIVDSDFDSVIEELKFLDKEFQKRRKRVIDVVKEKRKECSHQIIEYVGHDSHYDWYICKDCGERLRY